MTIPCPYCNSKTFITDIYEGTSLVQHNRFHRENDVWSDKCSQCLQFSVVEADSRSKLVDPKNPMSMIDK